MLFWKKDLPFPKSLINKRRRWQTVWQLADKELSSNLLIAFGARYEDAFPNIYCLLLIACPLPISRAEAGRSFSLIKTCTRSRMSEELFSDLAFFAMQCHERFEEEEISEAFVKAHPRILFQATLYDIWGM